jgi:hypothetical protein
MAQEEGDETSWAPDKVAAGETRGGQDKPPFVGQDRHQRATCQTLSERAQMCVTVEGRKLRATWAT